MLVGLSLYMCCVLGLLFWGLCVCVCVCVSVSVCVHVLLKMYMKDIFFSDCENKYPSLDNKLVWMQSDIVCVCVCV